MTKMNYSLDHSRRLSGSSAVPKQSVFAAKYPGRCANCGVEFGVLVPITLRKGDRKPVHGYRCPAKDHID